MEIVAGALPSLLPKLTELLKGEYNLQKGVKGGIIYLQAELDSMKVALEKISELPANMLDKQDKLWARDVRELSYDIEDKIDTFVVHCKAGNKMAGEAEQHGIKKAIDRSLKWLARPNIRRKIAIDIKDIKSRILEVHERRRRYEVNSNHSVDKPVKVDPRVLVRYEEATKLVGIDEARDEVIKILIHGDEVSRHQQEKIVSIVGFGGLGKTTLANVVYEKLREEFDCSAFILVSQIPDMEKLFNNLLYQFNKTYHASKNKVIDQLSEPLWEKKYEQLDKRNNASINNVIDKLREFLWEKRYLIVMDDIWDISVWKIIRCALTNNNGGCKIITTTCIMKVAEEVGGTYKMKPLSLESSRILLYRRIFGNRGKDKCPDEDLAKVSERILVKCAGVPLAIIALASLLANKGRNKMDWYEVYNSIGTGMENNTDMENMRKILSPSYFNLPSHIKTCFLYLSVFPEDYEIDRRWLIWMWIAEGFIQGGKQGQSLFEVGDSYFNELINRSMIQPLYDRHDMKIQSCRVHDLVLDLIHSLSSEKNFVTTLNDVGRKSAQHKFRRLCLHNDKVDHATHGATLSMQEVRSMVVFSSAVELIPALSRFEVVRVLNLQNCDLSHGYNLNHIGKLVHLRCLGLHSTKISQLPEEIGNLKFLQILDISSNALSTLPFTIVQLRQLKCLYIDLAGLEPNSCIGRLTSLEELSLLYAHHVNATELVEELCHLTELRVLNITYLGIDQPTDVLVECLHKLQKIETLSIDFLGCIGKLDGWVIGPQNLHSLQVDGCSFLKLPVWINHSQVQNLSFLVICVEELQPEDIEILGKLPALRDLDMYSTKRCSNIYRKFIIGAGSFPCLVRCKLRGYYERVVFQQGAMPWLTSLELDIYREVWSTWTGVPDLGFENLSSLLDLHVGLQYGRGSTAAEQAIAALMSMAEIHPNYPSVSAACYYQYL